MDEKIQNLEFQIQELNNQLIKLTKSFKEYIDKSNELNKTYVEHMSNVNKRFLENEEATIKMYNLLKTRIEKIENR